MKLVTFTMDSTFNWVRDARSLLIDDSVPRTEPSMDVLERAQFSLEVLDSSFFCLKTIEDETELVPATLAAIFLIDWEYRMAVASNDALDDETARKMKARMDFGASVHAFCGQISSSFFKSLSRDLRNSLGSILVQSITFAIFEEDKFDAGKLTSLCCLWMLEVLECHCLDQFEEHKLLDQFLSNDDFWPLWFLNVTAFCNVILFITVDVRWWSSSREKIWRGQWRELCKDQWRLKKAVKEIETIQVNQRPRKMIDVL